MKSDDWVKGYAKAIQEFETQDAPTYVNPFLKGSDAHDGYEEAVYDLTQK